MYLLYAYTLIYIYINIYIYTIARDPKICCIIVYRQRAKIRPARKARGPLCKRAAAEKKVKRDKLDTEQLDDGWPESEQEHSHKCMYDFHKKKRM